MKWLKIKLWRSWNWKTPTQDGQLKPWSQLRYVPPCMALQQFSNLIFQSNYFSKFSNIFSLLTLPSVLVSLNIPVEENERAALQTVSDALLGHDISLRNAVLNGLLKSEGEIGDVSCEFLQHTKALAPNLSKDSRLLELLATSQEPPVTEPEEVEVKEAEIPVEESAHVEEDEFVPPPIAAPETASGGAFHFMQESELEAGAPAAEEASQDFVVVDPAPVEETAANGHADPVEAPAAEEVKCFVQFKRRTHFDDPS